MHVLVPLDGSTYAEAAIVPAALLASVLAAPARGELHLTRVVSALPQQVSDEEVGRTERYLRSAIERLQHAPLTDAGVPLDVLMAWSVTVADDPATGIIQVAENSGKRDTAERGESCQVIAMVTHGLGGPQLWAMGSTTERVLQAARQPLLIVRR
jgi:nucleotide-binding universal stress UspA family protein